MSLCSTRHQEHCVCSREPAAVLKNPRTKLCNIVRVATNSLRERKHARSENPFFFGKNSTHTEIATHAYAGHHKLHQNTNFRACDTEPWLIKNACVLSNASASTDVSKTTQAKGAFSLSKPHHKLVSMKAVAQHTWECINQPKLLLECILIDIRKSQRG